MVWSASNMAIISAAGMAKTRLGSVHLAVTVRVPLPMIEAYPNT